MRSTALQGLTSTTLAAALFGGCAAEPAKPVATPIPVAAAPAAEAKPAPVATACLPKQTRETPLAKVSEQDGALVACFLEEHGIPTAGSEYPCLAIRGDGTFAAAPRWRAPAAPEAARVALPGPNDAYELAPKPKSVDVCAKAQKSCRTVKLGWSHPAGIGHGKHMHDTPIGAVSDDGKRLFLLAPEPTKPGAKKNALEFRVFGETWDIDTGKRLARVPLLIPGKKFEHVVSDDTAYWRAAWVGERVLLSAHSCCGPDAGVELLDPKSGSAIQLGDAMLFVRVTDERYLVGSVSYGASPTLTVLDARAAKILATFELTTGSMDSQEGYALDFWVRGDGTARVVYASPPSIVTVDVNAATIGKPQPLPLCE